MNNPYYILAGADGKIIAYSEQASQDILPFIKRSSAAEEEYLLPPCGGNILIAEKYYRVNVCPLSPGYTLYNFSQVHERTDTGTDLLTISCAELNHKLRNPLTSIKLVVDMLPLYIPESIFKDEAMRIFEKQLNKLEAYTKELEERVGGGSAE